MVIPCNGNIHYVDTSKKTETVMTPADSLLSCCKLIKDLSSGGVVNLVYKLT